MRKFFHFHRILPAILLLASAPAAPAQDLSDEEIRLLCEGTGGSPAPIVEDDLSADGQPEPSFSGTGLATDTSGFASFDDCVAALQDRTVKAETAGKAIPEFRGEIAYTAGNPATFPTFLAAHVGEVVFLELRFDFTFVRPEQDAIRETCNPGARIWDEGLAGQPIALPLGAADAVHEALTCSETRFAFAGQEFPLSSGGPGTHWFDIAGFFRVIETPDPAPHLRLEWVEADADMWSKVAD